MGEGQAGGAKLQLAAELSSSGPHVALTSTASSEYAASPMEVSRTVRVVKRVARALFDLEMGLRRRIARARGEQRYRLAGSCGGCGKCCEAPSIRVAKVMFLLPTLQRVFVWWQRRVNGFVLTDAERESSTLTFECTHFDRRTRRCTSYETRPGMCRDYPRLLLDQPWPDLFPECGYRAVASDAPKLLEILERQEMTPEQREELERRLFLK